jgi:phosphoglycerate dehydrogenase-like enzyme
MGMQVNYCNPRLPHDPAWPYTRVRTLEELVAGNDVISLHAVMSEANRHLFNAAVFARFKPGAFFVNTARGELVDSNALIEALDKGMLAGAALDVLDGEFEPGFEQRAHEHPLIRYAQRHKNLIITPHIAGSTKDAWSLTQRFVIEKAMALCAEKLKARYKRA